MRRILRWFSRRVLDLLVGVVAGIMGTAIWEAYKVWAEAQRQAHRDPGPFAMMLSALPPWTSWAIPTILFFALLVVVVVMAPLVAHRVKRAGDEWSHKNSRASTAYAVPQSGTAPASGATASPRFASTRIAYVPTPGRLGIQVVDDRGGVISQAMAVAVSEKNLRSDTAKTNDDGMADLSPVVTDFTYTLLVAHTHSEGAMIPGVGGAAGFRAVTLPHSDRFESWILSDSGGTIIDGLNTRLYATEEPGDVILRAIYPDASINGQKAGQLRHIQRNETVTIEDSLGAKLRLRVDFIVGGTSLARVFRLTVETRTAQRAEQIIASLPKRASLKKVTLKLAEAARDAILAYHGHLEDDEVVDDNVRNAFLPEITRVVDRLEKRLKRRPAARDVNLLSVPGWAALADALEDDAADLDHSLATRLLREQRDENRSRARGGLKGKAWEFIDAISKLTEDYLRDVGDYERAVEAYNATSEPRDSKGHDALWEQRLRLIDAQGRITATFEYDMRRRGILLLGEFEREYRMQNTHLRGLLEKHASSVDEVMAIRKAFVDMDKQYDG